MAFLLVACLGLVVAGGLLRGQFGAASRPLGVLPAEFERHEALLLAWDGDMNHRQWQVLSRVAAAACHRTRVIVIVPDAATRVSATRYLTAAGASPDRFTFLNVPVATTWIRDFGPLVVKGLDGEPMVVDAEYFGDEPNDAVPPEFARLCSMRIVRPEIAVEGGNFLSNGAGLCIATNRLWQANEEQHGYSKDSLVDLLQKYFGCREVVFLQQLAGEPTGHVDMFATFTAVDTVVVGSYSPGADPVNAEILDRNAARLAEVLTAAGPLKVYRIPMPARYETEWPTYTNVVYVNGTLLFPTYDSATPRQEARALAVYRELLPGWRIVTLDSTALIASNGALHCATNNVHQLPPKFLQQLDHPPTATGGRAVSSDPLRRRPEG